MMRKTLKTILGVGAAFGLCLLTACGGGRTDPVATAPDVTEQVTPAAVSDPATATAYTAALADTPTGRSDTLEPVAVPDQLATDDTAEPTT
jgi:hypothetical protein